VGKFQEKEKFRNKSPFSREFPVRKFQSAGKWQ
jgi:hypothetical protein